MKPTKDLQGFSIRDLMNDSTGKTNTSPFDLNNGLENGLNWFFH